MPDNDDYEYIEYSYNADTYCPKHVHGAIGKKRVPRKTVEESLAIYAARDFSIADYAKHEHDSNYFPVPGTRRKDTRELHRGQMCGEVGLLEGTTGDGEPHCYAKCAACRTPLGDECPLMGDITETEAKVRKYAPDAPSFLAWFEENGSGLSVYEVAQWGAYCAREDV